MPEIHVLDLGFLSQRRAIASFLIKSESDQGDILIETGPHSTFLALSAALEACGSSLSKVGHVLLTHIHLDHGGAAWALAKGGAQIYVHPLGLAHLRDPSKLISSATRLYGDEMDKLWGQIEPIDESRLQAVEDEAVLDLSGISIRALHTPGHAQHHIAWQLGGALFTGDVAGICIDQGPVIAPCPPPDLDVVAWKHSLEKLKSVSPTELYLTHFGRVEKQIPHHLDKVYLHLQELLSWMKEASLDISAKESSHIEKELEKRTLSQVQASGLSSSTQQAYLAANPPFMSVLGLRRYLSRLPKV